MEQYGGAPPSLPSRGAGLGREAADLARLVLSLSTSRGCLCQLCLLELLHPASRAPAPSPLVAHSLKPRGAPAQASTTTRSSGARPSSAQWTGWGAARQRGATRWRARAGTRSRGTCCARGATDGSTTPGGYHRRFLLSSYPLILFPSFPLSLFPSSPPSRFPLGSLADAASANLSVCPPPQTHLIREPLRFLVASNAGAPRRPHPPDAARGAAPPPQLHARQLHAPPLVLCGHAASLTPY